MTELTEKQLIPEGNMDFQEQKKRNGNGWVSQKDYFFFHIGSLKYVQECLRDIAGSVLNHLNKANITIKQVKWIFWFPTAYSSSVYMKYCSLLNAQ